MKSILVIGLGRFGRHVIMKLADMDHEVMAVDTDEERVNAILKYATYAQIGDSTDEEFLMSLGVRNFDACIVTIGDNFQASLEITSNLKELGAKYIIAKVASELQSKFLLMAGANEIVYPEKDIAEKVAVKCNTANLLDYIEVSSDYNIVEIKVPTDWIGKSLTTLNIRKKYNLNILAVSNNGIVTMPDGDYMFKEEDCLFIFGETNMVEKLIKKEI